MGNKRTYRSTPEPRFVKRSLETASGKNIDDAISKFDKITYNSDTNTFEIGSNLEVNGNLEVNSDTIFKGNLKSYKDSILTFYQGDSSQSPYMDISPIFDEITLNFNYYDGQAIENSISLDVSVSSNILTDKNTKTIFGKSILKDPGNPQDNNINLYVHYLRFTYSMGSTSAAIDGVLYSSNNTDISGTDVSRLKQLIKNPESYRVLLILSSIVGGSCGTLIYDGSTFVIYTGRDPISITKIEDKVKPI